MKYIVEIDGKRVTKFLGDNGGIWLEKVVNMKDATYMQILGEKDIRIIPANAVFTLTAQADGDPSVSNITPAESSGGTQAH